MSDDLNLKYRLGTGPGGPNLEDGLAWAAANDFHFLDFNADHGANALDTWSAERIQSVRQYCEQHDLHLGIHTLSGVNVAEFSPYMSEAIDAYIRANVDLGEKLGVHHVITHAGLHQSSEMDLRRAASLQHLQRAGEYAASLGVSLVLENLNVEPPEAELQYMGHTIEELAYYWDNIPAEHLQWAFSANHMHLLPGDFDAFIDAFGVSRIGLVLVADNRGQWEEHLLPGQGTMDFGRLFSRLEGDGYRGAYMLTFGNREQKIAGRAYLLDRAFPPEGNPSGR